MFVFNCSYLFHHTIYNQANVRALGILSGISRTEPESPSSLLQCSGSYNVKTAVLGLL